MVVSKGEYGLVGLYALIRALRMERGVRIVLHREREGGRYIPCKRHYYEL